MGNCPFNSVEAGKNVINRLHNRVNTCLEPVMKMLPKRGLMLHSKKSGMVFNYLSVETLLLPSSVLCKLSKLISQIPVSH